MNPPRLGSRNGDALSSSSVSVGAFLRARREEMQPEDVGLTRGPHRRVPGLRREEVARLAGISAEYYLRLEQGRDHQPSAQVLTALATALRLTADGLQYLHRLAYPLPNLPEPDAAGREVPDDVLELLGQWSATPAYVSDRNQDVLAANAMATAVAPGYLEPGVNLVAQVFGQALRAPYFEDWEDTAATLVASLRYHGDLTSPRLQELIGELSICSEDFRRLWATHDARPMTSGRTPTYVDPLGWVNFRWQTFDVPGRIGQRLTVYFGEAGSPEATAIAYLSARLHETRPSSLPTLVGQGVSGSAARSRASASREDWSVGENTNMMSS